jgi:hypothetical protein
LEDASQSGCGTVTAAMVERKLLPRRGQGSSSASLESVRGLLRASGGSARDFIREATPPNRGWGSLGCLGLRGSRFPFRVFLAMSDPANR